MGEVTLNLKEFNSSAAWGISPFSSNPGPSRTPPRIKGMLSSRNQAVLCGEGVGFGITVLA